MYQPPLSNVMNKMWEHYFDFPLITVLVVLQLLEYLAMPCTSLLDRFLFSAWVMSWNYIKTFINSSHNIKGIIVGNKKKPYLNTWCYTNFLDADFIFYLCNYCYFHCNPIYPCKVDSLLVSRHFIHVYI